MRGLIRALPRHPSGRGGLPTSIGIMIRVEWVATVEQLLVMGGRLGDRCRPGQLWSSRLPNQARETRIQSQLSLVPFADPSAVFSVLSGGNLETPVGRFRPPRNLHSESPSTENHLLLASTFRTQDVFLVTRAAGRRFLYDSLLIGPFFISMQMIFICRSTRALPSPSAIRFY